MITIDQIDFSILKPYNGKVTKCFEQLCYQIAQNEFDNLGKFTAIDGSGGDGGVEFYLELDNGEKWGWQCKFFGGNGRLSESSRKSSIENSLETACRNHPNLTKWFLCLKTDLTPNSIDKSGKETKGEQDWFDNELPKQIPDTHKTEIEFWGESRFLLFINSHKHIGIRSFFFGALEFTKEWFEKRFQENFEKVKDKYDQELHTIDDHTQSKIDFALLDPNYLKNLEKFEEELDKNLTKLKSLINDFESTSVSDESEVTLKNEFISHWSSFEAHTSRIFNYISAVKSYFLDNLDSDVLTFDFKQHYFDYFSYRTDSKNSDFKEHSELYKKSGEIYLTYGNIGEDFRRFFENYVHTPTKKIHFLAKPAKGKTHLSTDVAYKRVANDKPAIFLTGDKFTNETSIIEAIQKNLDIPNQYSIDDFIQALDVYGSITKTKIPIIIDGLNETIFGKTFSSIWKDHLGGFIKKLASSNNLVLITTCRSSYQNRVYENESNDFHYLSGFGNFDVLEEAISKYFDKYKIVSNQAFNFLLSFSALYERFSTPLFLRIFCEVKNPDWRDGKEVFINLEEESAFGIFDDYLAQINKKVTTNSPILREGDKFIQKSLNKIAKDLWENNSREISIDDFYDLIDGNHPYEKDLSKADILISEGLVINRDNRNDEEYISVTYDLLAGYLIAKNIIESTNFQITDLLSDQFISRIIHGENQHPLYDDIIYSICLLLPQIKQQYLHDVFELNKNIEINEKYKKYTFAVSVNSLFKLPARYVNEAAVNLIIELFKRRKENQPLLFKESLKTLADVEHHLNGELICTLLAEMEMNRRDLSWSEFIRENSDTFESLILDFESQCKVEGDESKNLIQKQHILAKYITWILTSTNRKIRDLATRSLYFYGRKFPIEFSDIVYESLKANDPYIWERTLAALYGVCMAEHNSLKTGEFRNEILPEIAKNIYDLIFAKKAPHSTTHILSRDYARRIIEISLIYNPALFSTKKTARIRPPYKDGGVRKLEEFDYEDSELQYSGPLRMDFSNYTIGYIVKDGHSYSNPPEKKKVRRQIYQRIFDLGWSEELFKEIDRYIERTDYTHFPGRTEKSRVERYGKKYSWIAYFENAGLRKDLGLLEKEWEDFRISDADIDPSFPVPVLNEKFIHEDLLGDRTTELMDWIENGGLPLIDHHLLVKNLNDSEGEWVCLDGYINQEDNTFQRSRFTFVRTLLIKEDDYAEAIELLKKQDLGNRWLPEKIENYYSFAGELYLFNEATHDNFAEIEFFLNRKKVTIKKGDPDYEPIKSVDFVDNQIIVITEEPDEIEKEINEMRTFQVLLPVMEFNWEGYHSEVNDAGSLTIVSKEIANYLKLVNQPQTFDLFEQNGMKASINLQYLEDFSNRHYFVYLRKDLLDNFLNENKLRLVHAIWGEREISFKDHQERDIFYSGNSMKGYKLFQK